MYQDPTSLFEHFAIVGLHPDTKLQFVEDAYIREKKLEEQMKNDDIKIPPHRKPKPLMMEPQVWLLKRSNYKLQNYTTFHIIIHGIIVFLGLFDSSSVIHNVIKNILQLMLVQADASFNLPIVKCNHASFKQIQSTYVSHADYSFHVTE